MHPKKHINFFNINFLHPIQKHPILGPQKKVYVPHFLGKNAKKRTHINFFGGILGAKNGVPNGPFSATKSLVSCFFLPLLVGVGGMGCGWKTISLLCHLRSAGAQLLGKQSSGFASGGGRREWATDTGVPGPKYNPEKGRGAALKLSSAASAFNSVSGRTAHSCTV